MKRLILIGQSLSGKTTLLQRLHGQPLLYKKTQALECTDISIDTPGEYLENRRLNNALITSAYDADIIGLVQSALVDQTMFSPYFASVFNKPVIGIVTKADDPDANIQHAKSLLENAGAQPIFITSSITEEGFGELIKYLH